MKKEDYSRIDDKLDRQTEILMNIQKEINQEVSLIKLAHQKLKYMTLTLMFVFALKVSLEYPKIIVFVKKLL